MGQPGYDAEASPRKYSLKTCSHHEEWKGRFGLPQCLKESPQNQSQTYYCCQQLPALRRSEIEYYALLSGAGVHHYNGSNIDLGTACGKYFRVSMLTVTDAGDSDINFSVPGQ